MIPYKFDQSYAQIQGSDASGEGSGELELDLDANVPSRREEKVRVLEIEDKNNFGFCEEFVQVKMIISAFKLTTH